MLLSVCNVGIFAEEETAEKAVDISEDMFAENAEEKPELQSEVAAGQNFLAASDSGTCGKNLTWTLDEGGTLTISGTGAMGDYSYNAMPWYDYRNSIKTAVIEDGVTSIGDRAFWECNSLESVNIPDSVTSIGNSAFAYCVSLESVTIGNSVTSIDKNAFSACRKLASVIIPASLTSLAYGVFAYCSSLTDVYYTGTEEQWKAILVGAENDSLLNARIHYNYDSSVVAAGDANGDGVIDIKDAVHLAQHLAGWSVSIDENAADCNGDGKVDIKDAVLLAQYLAGWNVTLG